MPGPQYVHYSVESGGEICTPVNGIPRGCALSPLVGASLLRHIDGYYRSLNPDEVFYVRYMDDFLLLTRTRWQLRRGVWFAPDWATIAPRALNNHRERLYEQARRRGLSHEAASERVRAYEVRWKRWAAELTSRYYIN